jgi:hypothetical protein
VENGDQPAQRGDPCAGADRLAESFLSSPEPLRSSPLIPTATELANQQSRIKPLGECPGGFLRFRPARPVEPLRQPCRQIATGRLRCPDQCQRCQRAYYAWRRCAFRSEIVRASERFSGSAAYSCIRLSNVSIVPAAEPSDVVGSVLRAKSLIISYGGGRLGGSDV